MSLRFPHKGDEARKTWHQAICKRGTRLIDPLLREDKPGTDRPAQHIGLLYRNDEQMIVSACCYIVEGLRRGEAVIVVATRSHWSAMVGRLAMESSIDLVDAVMHGQLRNMDADIVLSSLLDDGMPDPHRFEEGAGSLIERARKRFGGVRVFAQLAGILWQEGNRAAAVRLEELWNGLARRLPFALLCPYQTDIGGTDGYNSLLKCVCSAHSYLLPSGNGGQASPEANALKQDIPPCTKALRETA